MRSWRCSGQWLVWAASRVHLGGKPMPTISLMIYYWISVLGLLICSAFPVTAADDGVCARVGLRLDQSAVMTRTAFRATLELNNNDPAVPLSSIAASVEIKDAQGLPANARFSIQTPNLENIDRLDGNGTLGPSSKAFIRWLLIPAEDAAPTAPTEFFVGGQFSYNLGGTPAQVVLEPVKITVYPDAALELKYFHQREVFSDDPFTPEVEPPQPYSLVVMVKNRGAGAAKSLKISSGQPQIVSNDKGLLIDFRLVNTVLEGTNTGNSLSLDFGRIEPGAIKIAEWQFASSLQGFFRDFSATFQHEDSLGETRLSTIKSVSIHEMTHLVEAGYAFADGRADFLVNDVPDPEYLPDTLYLSDGTNFPVGITRSFNLDQAPSQNRLQVQLTAPLPSGWAYLRIPEPSDGQLTLTSVQRSDGAAIAVGRNVWTTDRVFPGPSVRPIRTNILHLLDFDSTGVYTLFYNNSAPSDSVPPSSQVAALPSQSTAQIPLTWSGEDNSGGSGIASFDIFVSEDNGPFVLWLGQTALQGAIFSGAVGKSYSFYSRATDNSGNRETAPGSPDAQTMVSIVNHAPVLPAFGTQTLDEGSTLSLLINASDTDLPANTLTYALGPGAPAGAFLNPSTGLLTWPTSEALGPSTNQISIRVSDNGTPSLSSTGSVTIIIREVNTPPSLAPIIDRRGSEGQLVTFTNTASDLDIPAQNLSFSLGSGAPAGTSVHPVTGVFSWRPSDIQGGTTNKIAIIVSDDGLPMLSSTQFFSINVRDTRPDFALNLGSTQILAGASASVPVHLASGLDLVSINLDFSLSGEGLTNLNLTSLAPEVASANILSKGQNRYAVHFDGRADNPLQGNFPLAQLAFDSAADAHSTIARLTPASVAGTRNAAGSALSGKGQQGRVFLVGPEPIVDAWFATNQNRMLTLYGHPGASYEVSYSTNLSGTNWSFARRVPLTNLFQTFQADVPSQQVYYRAHEFSADPPLLELKSGGTNASLIIYGRPGTNYNLQYATNLAGLNPWYQQQSVVLTNSFRVLTNLGISDSIRFYKVQRP